MAEKNRKNIYVKAMERATGATVSSRIVSYIPKENGNESLMVIGVKNPGKIADIVGAYQGKEADDIWEKLKGNM